jgi:uncharacterized caspase-like protein
MRRGAWWLVTVGFDQTSHHTRDVAGLEVGLRGFSDKGGVGDVRVIRKISIVIDNPA